MDKYDVKIPVAGFVFFTDIEAESEEEAIAKAMEMNLEDGSIEELCMYEQICEGNVCNADLNEAEASEVMEADEDFDDDDDENDDDFE